MIDINILSTLIQVIIKLKILVILPPSALAQISDLRDYKYNGEVIYTLRILNIRSHIHTHCIPGDYFAEEGVCYLPQHVY